MTPPPDVPGAASSPAGSPPGPPSDTPTVRSRELLATDLPTAHSTRDVGRVLGGVLQAGDVVVLVGELGAGKTTLTQGLADGLGVRGPITSPTFVLSRVHPSTVGGPALVHVDAYRLGDAAELEDIDLDATVADSVTVVEWGSGMAEQLSDSLLVVELVRRTGADALHEAVEDTVDVGPPEPSTGEIESAVQDAEDDVLAEDHDDPRAIRVIGVGPRWQDVPPLG